jgi:pyruvate dehydrogenase E2 component (dihydrolipoamide acetyltransferase)
VFEFKLPDLGEGIHEGEILKWHVAAGGTVEEDAPLVDVETDKAAVTIPSPRGGRVVSLAGAVGDTIEVGQVITVIDDGGAATAPVTEKEPARPAAAAVPAATAPKAPAARPEAPGPAARPPGRPVPAAPATRRLARELGVDINQVPATGPGGRVTAEDVQRLAAGGVPATAATGPAPTPPSAHVAAEQVGDDREALAEFAAHAAAVVPFLDLEPLPDFSQFGPIEVEPLRSIRRKVARKMVTSMILIPHVAHMDEADVTELEEFRKRERERRKGQPGGRLTLLAFVVKAVTAGLKKAPSFNASLDPFKQEIVYKQYYNIGIAADTGRGLVVPVIKSTDRKSIVQISADIEDLATRARDGKLEVDEMRGGTFTITNIGPLGGTALLPTINYPEVAILAMGQVQEKPVVRKGEIVIRKILPLTLAFDHRITDGADAARFVSEMVRQLSDPNLLLLET